MTSAEHPLLEQFTTYSVAKLRQYAGRIDDCLGRLTEEQIWARSGENTNAVGNLVLHLGGNVRQWIVAGVGGRADVRERDAEFTARGSGNRRELSSLLKDVVEEACVMIESVPDDRFPQPLEIQGYGVTVFEAIYHVVEHFSHHTGQILFATKQLTGAELGYYRHLQGSARHGQQTP